MGRRPFARHVDGVDLEALLAAARSAPEPDSRARARAQRAARRATGPAATRRAWPTRPPSSWGSSRCRRAGHCSDPPGAQATLTTAEAWLGAARTARDTAPDEIVLRYLAAFGPATVADVRAWSGLTGVRAVVERLRPRLRSFRDERGAELLDVPGAAAARRGRAAPPRFLPEFDNVLVAHADRARIIEEHYNAGVIASLGRPTVLVDGFVRGYWKIVREDGAATLVVEPFDALSKRNAAAVRAEGRRLLAFAAPDAGTREVRVVDLSQRLDLLHPRVLGEQEGQREGDDEQAGGDQHGARHAPSATCGRGRAARRRSSPAPRRRSSCPAAGSRSACPTPSRPRASSTPARMTLNSGPKTKPMPRPKASSAGTSSQLDTPTPSWVTVTASQTSAADDDQQAGLQHLAAEARHQRVGGAGRDRDAERHRDEGQAGVDRREVQPELEEQRDDQQQPGEAGEEHDPDDQARGEGAVAQQARRDQRVLARAALDGGEDAEQRDAGGHQAEGPQRPAELAALDQRVDQAPGDAALMRPTPTGSSLIGVRGERDSGMNRSAPSRPRRRAGR